jgi:hypothetical protein
MRNGLSTYAAVFLALAVTSTKQLSAHESPWDWMRLNTLRGLSHDEVKKVFT